MSAGLDLARFERGKHPATWFALVRAVPETTTRFESGFEAREIPRCILGRNINRNEILEACGVDEIATAVERVKRGCRRRMSPLLASTIEFTDTELEIAHQNVHERTLSDPGRPDHGTQAPILEGIAN